MNKSESIKDIALALSKFQGDVKNPSNTATNPFFKSKYAPLAEVLNTIKPVLEKNGLSVIQSPSTDGDNIVITTLLLHESGEWIESDPLSLKMDKVTAQGAGSAITYARRYALSAILGISSEDDDDGNGAEPKKPNEKAPTQNDGKMDKYIVDNSLATDNQVKAIYAISKSKNYTEESVNKYIKQMHGKDSTKALTKKEASSMIEMLNAIKEQ